MKHYGCSLRELQEWTIPQALEFGNVAARVSKEQRLVFLNDMVHALGAVQSEKGHESFMKLVKALEREQ